MGYKGHIPYDPRTDPDAMFAQGVQNMLAGFERQFEKKRQIGDVRDVAKYIQGGLRGEAPTPKTEIGMQLMGQVAMQQAAQAVRPQARTKIQELTDEGYTPQEAKMIRDISHGLEPRASTRQRYENMTEIEKLDFLSKVKQRAEGQYYGLPSAIGNIEPRDPKLLAWTLRELNKLPQYRKQKGTKLDNRDYFISDYNIPQTFEQLGITGANDQIQIQELDKALPDMDVRADVARDPQFYQNLLKALRDKEIDIKKAIEIIKSEKTKGLVEQGNIDLNNQTVHRNKDGSISTVKSRSFSFDGVEVLLDMVDQSGKLLTDKEAIEQYKKTGKHLGKFSSVEAADRYAEQLHRQQAELHKKKKGEIDISDIPEPKTKSEFINMLRRLKESDEPKSRKYYNEYLDKFW